MGCGCGGRKKASPRSQGAAQQQVIDPRPHEWVVEFPNGATQAFETEWQANAASAVGGGTAPVKRYTDDARGVGTVPRARNPHVQRGGFGAPGGR